MTKEEAKEKLLESGVQLYKEQGKSAMAKEAAERAGVPKSYVNWCFGSAVAFWKEVQSLVEAGHDTSEHLENAFFDSEEIREMDFEWASSCKYPLDVKIIDYLGRSPIGEGRVVYCFFGKRCVFSGITNSRMGANTASAAEKVIGAILNRESIALEHLLEYTFYDLKTQRGYDNYASGYYCFEQLTLGTGIEGYIVGVAEWTEVDCPEIVFETFKDFHGAKKRYSRDELFKLKTEQQSLHERSTSELH